MEVEARPVELTPQTEFTPEMLLALGASLDWIDQANCIYWLGLGKKQIWFDYLALLDMGRNGAWLERELAGWGIVVYGKFLMPLDGGIAAFVLVDRRHEARVRKWLGKLGVLL